jgi:anti-anti-sigma factor
MSHHQTTSAPAPLRDDAAFPWLRIAESYGDDGTLRVALQGELDIASAARVRRRLCDLRATGTPAVLDLSGIDFIDCGGLRVILEALEAADDEGSRLAIAPEYSAALRRLLELIDAAGRGRRLRGFERLDLRDLH